MSSSAHFVRSPLGFGDLSGLNAEEYYPWTAYGQSKLAQAPPFFSCRWPCPIEESDELRA